MNYTVDIITPEDDEAVCGIIKAVGAEYGAVGEGFGPSDPEVECMSTHYGVEFKSQYLVAKLNGEVVGGCGVASFANSNEVCELKKLFLLPSGRGLGLGRELSERCLDFARTQGFKSCYLDTLESMTAAISLYESLGFKHLKQPLQGTEHNGCDVWMLMQL